MIREDVMEYRAAEVPDIEAILRITASAVEEMERHHIFQWDRLYPAKEDFLADIENGTLFVGMLNGEVAVTFTINRDCDEQYSLGAWKYPDSEYRILHRLCVDPVYQNRGIAGKTLDYIEEELRSSGVETIRLDVFCGNPYALSLYRGCGYEEVGTAEWRKGRFFLMEKRL